jgi:flagellar motor switch protein FliM
MIHGQNVKRMLAVNQASTTNGATASGNIDTLGFDHCAIAVYMTTSDNATNNPSVLKVSESDDTVVTNFADVTGLVGDTSFTIPASPTSATNALGPFVVLNVNCQRRKRYLKVSVTPITTQSITVAAELTRGETTPDTATEMNAGEVVTL